MAVINTTTKDILQTYQNAYLEQIGRKMVIGSEEYTLASIFSYVQAVYAEMLNHSNSNRFLDTASGEFLDAIAKQYNLDRTPITFGNPFFDGYFDFNDPDGRTYEAGQFPIQVAGYTYTNSAAFTMHTGSQPLKWVCTVNHSDGLTYDELYNAVVGEGKPFSLAGVLSNGLQNIAAPMTDDSVFRAYVESNKRIYTSGIAESFESAAMLTSKRIVDAHCVRQSESDFEVGKVKLHIKPESSLLGRNIVNDFDLPAVIDSINSLKLLVVGQTLEVGLLEMEYYNISDLQAYIDPAYSDSGQRLVDLKCSAIRVWINNHLRITDPLYPGQAIEMLKTPLSQYSTDPRDFNLTAAQFAEIGDFCVIDAKAGSLTRKTAGAGKYVYLNRLECTAVLM